MVRQDPPRQREQTLLPDFFDYADRAALTGQRQAIRWYVGQIIMLLLASVVAIPDIHAKGLNLSPALSLLAFVGAYYFWERLREERPQAVWYAGRAAAELMKTLVWKYSVRAKPFDGPPESAEADAGFAVQMGEVFQTFQDTKALRTRSRPDITEEMRRRRASPLSARRDVYLNERVRGQRTWYRSRADECDSEAAKWQAVSIVAIIIGASFAVLQIFQIVPWHVLGTFTTVAASVTAWTQLKQYGPLSAAYRLAATELDMLEVQLERLDINAPEAEENWSRLAADAEDAITREHTVWRARRDRAA
ncbi:DUF4231 domain-containing protein [Phaeacidiphilus oryzae]|jgi:putative Mn2+ efflux pump MntP|uniref:DUF4231 domain-containing protein n=1 Tax=Phaeacidiphilus oryzae TaxID=348818 RepID=UPI00056382EB|nr:DUF4231 domain-containing protein [Phaeacidiphilus oryzae]